MNRARYIRGGDDTTLGLREEASLQRASQLVVPASSAAAQQR